MTVRLADLAAPHTVVRRQATAQRTSGTLPLEDVGTPGCTGVAGLLQEPCPQEDRGC
jgi:hypothetical protein